MKAIDLRSDTVTRPTPAMREAIAKADVGDDVFGEDPSVHALEAEVAEITGKEAALFVTSGTMGNQLAIALQTRPGDEVIVGEGAHVVFYESGAGAALSGVQFAIAGSGGLYDADALRGALLRPGAGRPGRRRDLLRRRRQCRRFRRHRHRRAGSRPGREGRCRKGLLDLRALRPGNDCSFRRRHDDARARLPGRVRGRSARRFGVVLAGHAVGWHR